MVSLNIEKSHYIQKIPLVKESDVISPWIKRNKKFSLLSFTVRITVIKLIAEFLYDFTFLS
jgi:hypothetical protein